MFIFILSGAYFLPTVLSKSLFALEGLGYMEMTRVVSSLKDETIVSWIPCTKQRIFKWIVGQGFGVNINRRVATHGPE